MYVFEMAAMSGISAGLGALQYREQALYEMQLLNSIKTFFSRLTESDSSRVKRLLESSNDVKQFTQLCDKLAAKRTLSNIEKQQLSTLMKKKDVKQYLEAIQGIKFIPMLLSAMGVGAAAGAGSTWNPWKIVTFGLIGGIIGGLFSPIITKIAKVAARWKTESQIQKQTLGIQAVSTD